MRCSFDYGRFNVLADRTRDVDAFQNDWCVLPTWIVGQSPLKKSYITCNFPQFQCRHFWSDKQYLYSVTMTLPKYDERVAKLATDSSTFLIAHAP